MKTSVFRHASFAILAGLVVPALDGQSPGRLSDGRFLLPNGWYLSPAGRQVELGGLPLKLLPVPGQDYMLVMSNGYTEHFIASIDVREEKVAHRVSIPQGFLGLVASPDGQAIYASAGGNEHIQKYSFTKGTLRLQSEIRLPAGSFPAGLAINPDGKRLYVAGNLSGALHVVDLESGRVTASIRVGAKPYTCVISKDATKAYVSNWGGDSVSVVDLNSNRLIHDIKVRHKPNDLLMTSDGGRLFVASGNWNTVSVIETARARVVEEIDIALVPNSLPGSTPNALALSPDGKVLYVANADNNSLAVIDVSNPNRSVPRGFIPTGWYPSAVAVSPDGRKIVVANGKGLQSVPTPKREYLSPQSEDRRPSIHSLLEGALSFIDLPDAKRLGMYSEQVHKNSPYSKGRNTEPKPLFTLGVDCPIRYVFYIIKENRTYDQILGDMEEGNGDPDYCLFPEEVTPNHHALARQFVLFDNLYHDAEVSADGHHWVTSAYATDYVEKLWPSTYSGRGKLRPDYHDDPDAYSAAGFLWDRAAEAGISYRSYGEFARRQGAEPAKVRPATPSLAGHIHPTYLGASGTGPGGSSIVVMSDMDRYRLWREEFEQFEKQGEMPRLTILSLPRDHTMGTRPGVHSPRAMVADNDLGLGHIVETLSRSRFWKNLAIFVIEDDTQSGPDHVDVHRTVGFVISPYIKRRFVDSTMYSSMSMLKTMEQILGLRPMTQYDAGAMPMWNAFQSAADLSPYRALPARVPLDEKNLATAYGAQRSLVLNLDDIDSAPDHEFNEILWKAIKGPDAVLPPRRVAAFVAPLD
ncbi:MAG: bifunctional YncE family protein/alkaline phosphatase family protein [Opitutaceae bacterium]|nr:bifunctional YncE family protein/alkaline phosphatase family protein [Opitutaceae bacterium]